MTAPDCASGENLTTHGDRNTGENNFNKGLQCGRVLFDSRTQDRPLIGIDQEVAEFARPEIVANRALLLSFCNDRRDLFAPKGQHFQQFIADLRGVLRDLRHEFANQAPIMALREMIVEGGEMLLEAYKRRKFAVAQDAPIRGAFAILGQYFCRERFLAFEVVVEGALRNARGIGDVLDAAGAEASLDEQL